MPQAKESQSYMDPYSEPHPKHDLDVSATPTRAVSLDEFKKNGRRRASFAVDLRVVEGWIPIPTLV